MRCCTPHQLHFQKSKTFVCSTIDGSEQCIQVGLDPDMACKLQPNSYAAWQDEHPSPDRLQQDTCLRMAIQQLQQPPQITPAPPLSE